MPVTVQQILFILSGALTLGAALLVVTRRNLFHAALFLTLSCFGVAGLFVLLEAPFLAGVHLFVYVGATAILIVFATTLMREMMNPALPGANRQWAPALLVAVALCGVLGWLALQTMAPLEWYLTLAAALFCTGLYGVLSRRNAIAILMGVELMLNAVNVNLVAFWRYAEPAGTAGQVFALFVYAVAVAEVAVGLALVLIVRRTHDTVVPEDVDLLKG